MELDGKRMKPVQLEAMLMLIYFFFRRLIFIRKCWPKNEAGRNHLIQDILFQGRKKELVREYPAVWTVQFRRLPTFLLAKCWKATTIWRKSLEFPLKKTLDKDDVSQDRLHLRHISSPS